MTDFFDANSLSDVKYIRNFVKENNISIIYLHFVSFKDIIYFKLAVKGLKNVKILWHVHHRIPQSKKFIRKLILSGVSIIGCSSTVADEAISIKGSDKNVYFVENAIDFSRLDVVTKENEYKHYFDNDEFKILMFGFSFKTKGVDIAQKAVDKLIKKGLNIHLYISISSNYDIVKEETERIFSKIPDWLTFLPPNNQISIYYRNCNVYLSASREEGFCYSLVEAAYNKRGLIASIIPAQRDLQLRCCNWFKSEDVDDLADKIELLYNNYDNEAELEKQKQEVVAKYDIDVWAKEVFDIFNILV